MGQAGQAFQARDIANRLVVDVMKESLGDPVIGLQALGIACGMMFQAACIAGKREIAKAVLYRAQAMGAEWDGDLRNLTSGGRR
jgi:hypothetical protein